MEEAEVMEKGYPVTMSDFDDLILKLEKNVYGSAKGVIRMALLSRDLEDYVPGFTEGSNARLRISDIGGGAGRFAMLCAEKGHRIRLSDISEEMLKLAQAEIDTGEFENRITIFREDFLNTPPAEDWDLYCLHGSAEWMDDSKAAIHKICSEMRPGSYLSLLMFNSDRLKLKEGINGWLHPDIRPAQKRNLYYLREVFLLWKYQSCWYQKTVRFCFNRESASSINSSDSSIRKV